MTILSFPEAQNRAKTNRPARGPRRRGPRASRFVTCALADSYSALATRRIGMCGYTGVLEDERTYIFLYIQLYSPFLVEKTRNPHAHKCTHTYIHTHTHTHTHTLNISQ